MLEFSIRGGAGAGAREKSRDEVKAANIKGEHNDAGCLNFSIRGSAGAGARRKSRDGLKEQIKEVMIMMQGA